MENAIITSSKLKELNSRLDKKKAEKAVLQIQLRDLKNKDRNLDREIDGIVREIGKYKQKEGLTVSEHCIIRYLQRVELIPVEDVPGKIITEELKRIHSILGNGEFPLGDTGYSVIIKNNVIITIK